MRNFTKKVITNSLQKASNFVINVIKHITVNYNNIKSYYNITNSLQANVIILFNGSIAFMAILQYYMKSYRY